MNVRSCVCLGAFLLMYVVTSYAQIIVREVPETANILLTTNIALPM